MKIRALCVAVVAVGLLFTAAGAGKLEKCTQRCERRYGAPTPSPSPMPTVSPLDCEPIGGQQKFTVGRDRMFCFTVADGPTFVEVASTSPANAGCAYFRTEFTSPSGLKSYGEGAYPMGVVFRTPGRHYFWVSPLWIADGSGCDTYVFTVR